MGEATDLYFPIKTVRKKSDELPWVNSTIRKQRRRNRNLFRKEGRIDTWKNLHSQTERLEEDRRKEFLNEQKKKLTAE